MVQKRIITKYSFWFGKLMQCVILNERLQKFVDVRIMSFVVEHYDENGELCCLFCMLVMMKENKREIQFKGNLIGEVLNMKEIVSDMLVELLHDEEELVIVGVLLGIVINM